MSDSSGSQPPALPALLARLEEVAALLRQPGALDHETKEALADLVTELSQAIKTSGVPGPALVDLAHNTAGLAESLHQETNPGLLGGARNRLADAVLEIDVHHPVMAGVLRRLLDALANIGI